MQLSEDWKYKTIGEVATLNPKLEKKESIHADMEVQFLPMKLVEEKINKVHLTETRLFIELQKGSYTAFIDDDIIFAKVTPCMENGKVAVVKNLKNKIGYGSSEFHVVRCGDEILNQYLFYFIVQDKFRNEAQHAMTGAVGLRRVPKQFLENYKIPVPPKPIQQTIVSKIEELFSELDKGIEQLKTAQQQLKTYRQAVLKWAFEGKLTNENVKDGELPEGWKMMKLKDITKDISDGDHQAPPKSALGIPFITISNVNKDDNKIDFTNTFTVSQEYYAKLKINRKPLKGDVLYTVTGSFGIPILIDFEKDFCFQRHIGLVRPLESTNQKWLFYLLQSSIVFNQAKSTATGTAQKTVALNSLRNFDVPFFKIEEQNRIVQEIECRLSVADKMEESITQSMQQAEALRQSILKKAFEGKLNLL